VADQFTEFNYLLNAFERASQAERPVDHGYRDKRVALIAHVRELERKAAAYDALVASGVKEVPPSPAMDPQRLRELAADAARLDWLERERADARKRGFQWSSWAYDALQSERTIREQIDASRGVKVVDDASSCPQSPLEQKEGPA
jgi:hypothetical protein